MLCQLCAALPDQLDGVSVSSLALFSIADFDALDPAVQTQVHAYQLPELVSSLACLEFVLLLQEDDDIVLIHFT